MSPKFVIAIIFLVIISVAAACGGKGKEGEEPAIATGTISGQVVDSANAGVKEATVVTLPATSSVTTDAEGKFSISQVPVGVYAVTATRSGYKVGFRGDVSVTAGKAVTVKLILANAEPFPLAQVRAIRAADNEIYPDKKVWITLTAGYGDHDNNKIITTGLPNVAVGSYVYLEGKNTDAQGVKITKWNWELTPPAFSKAVLEKADTQYPRILTDRAGKYEVKVTVTNEKGQTSSFTLAVNAGTYVGEQICATCHSGSVMPDVVSEWSDTGHASMFERMFETYKANFQARKADYCVGCHTTGYNETDQGKGFDELARLADWDPKKESFVSWLVSANKSLDDIANSPADRLMNIQCESCHGPGSVHIGARIFEPGVCNQCHAQFNQLSFAAHYEGEHVGSRYLSTASSPDCARCHTGQGYVVGKINNEKLVFPDMATPVEPANMMVPGNQAAIACAACHDPHQATYPERNQSAQLRVQGDVKIPASITIKAGVAATCVECHADRRDKQYMTDFVAGKLTRGVHENTQADVFYGVGAFTYGLSYVNSPHTMLVKEGCVQCHMAPNPAVGQPAVTVLSVGGHSFNMKHEYQGKELENIGACTTSGCHATGALTTFNRLAGGDYDGNGKVEGVQTEVKGLLAILATKLPKDAAGNILSSNIKPDNTTEAQRQALWNYWLVTNDGSLGIHNTAFTVRLLQQTYKQLTGSDVPGAIRR